MATATQISVPAPPARPPKGRQISTTTAYRNWLHAAAGTIALQRPAKMSGRVALEITLADPAANPSDAIDAVADLLVSAGLISSPESVANVAIGWNAAVEPGACRVTVRAIISKSNKESANVAL